MSITHPTSLKLTAEQFLCLGEDPPGVRLELIDGEIIVSPSINPEHSHIDRTLSQILLNHIRPNKLGLLFGDTVIVWSNHTVRRPDLCYYSNEKRHLVTARKLLAPPDLCIEILSPGNPDDDLIHKFNLYESHAVPFYWIIDPATQTLRAFALQNNKYVLIATASKNQTITIAPFPTLKISLGDLWLTL